MQLLVALPHPVHDDPLAGAAGVAGEGQLDRGDHLAAGAIGHQAAEELRVGVGLDRVGDQRAGEGRAVRGQPRSGGVQIGKVEGRAPARGGIGADGAIEHRLAGYAPERTMPVDWKLEVVVVPVTDVDGAKPFYSEKLGFVVDVDQAMGEEFRVVQLTPPGSGCSITIGKGLSTSTPGSYQGLQLVVADIEAAHAGAGRAGRRDHPGPPHGQRCVDRRQGRPLELVLLLQRPRWQRLGGPGEARGVT